MITFRQAVYMVLDLLKELSDDAYYTEEHIMFLLSRARATLLKKKYDSGRNRNQPYTDVNKSNFQQIEFELEATAGPVHCGNPGGNWYKGTMTKSVPKINASIQPTAFLHRDIYNELVNVVPAERLSFVGYNKWLKRQIYCAISDDNNIYVRQLDEDAPTLTSIILSAVFDDALEAAELSSSSEDNVEDMLDKRFPLEDGLVLSCIEWVYQELTGARYAPEDKYNNGRDDLSEVAVARKGESTPALDSETNNRQ